MQITNNKKEQHMDMIKREEYKYTPKHGFVLTHFKTVQDVKQSAEFYLRVFGGKVIRSGEPFSSFCSFWDTSIIILSLHSF